jgi:predicted SAM-dependent methyltransferase
VLTVDVDARADAYVNIMRPLPFPNASLDGIFCEEVIEHIPLDAGRALLRECKRILKPGATLRLATPDLCWFANRLLANPAQPAEINEIFYSHDHRHLFTPDELERECVTIGFKDPRRSHYRDDASVYGWLDSHAERFRHPPEMSQYLEVRA